MVTSSRLLVKRMLLNIALLGGVIFLFSSLLYADISQVSSQESDTQLVPLVASLEEWQEVLKPTEDCPLPCWWGIYPGITTLDEAKRIIGETLEGQTWLTWASNEDYESIVAFPENPVENGWELSKAEIYKPFGLIIQGDENNMVDIILLGFSDSLSIEHRQVWKYFEPVNLIDIYDTPSLVRTSLHRISGELVGVELILYWDDIDLGVGYDITFSYQEGTSEVGGPLCFKTNTLSSLGVYFQNANSPRPLEDLVSDTRTISTRPLSEITELSEEEFTAVFVENEGCIPTDFPIKD